MIHHAAPCAAHTTSRAAVLLTAFVLAAAASVSAQTTVSVPCARDNTLYQNATGALSNGAGTGLFVGLTGSGGIRRTLVRFDVAAMVPSGARIVSAMLIVEVAQSTFSSPLNVTGHRVLQTWGEGTSVAGGGGGGGAPATVGDATWLHTFFATNFWTNAGGDFAAAPSLLIVTQPTGPASSTLSAAMLGDVQGWLDTPAQNFGWLLKAVDETTVHTARRLVSRESATGTAPVLQVTYITPGQSAAFGQGCPVGGLPFTCGMVGAPIGGTTVQVTQTNGPAGQLAANLVSLSYDPAGFPLLPQCSLYLPFGGLIVTQSLLFLSNTGAGSTTVNLPPGFPGLLLVWQSAAIDSNPAGFVLSSALLSLLQ